MNYEFLKSYLRAHGITRAQFAKDMQIPFGTVNTIFTRKPAAIKSDLLMKIAKTYGISLDDLLNCDDSYINVNYERLDMLIKDRGISRAYVSKKIGMYSGTLGNAFLRRSKMKVYFVKRIADLLKVSISDFTDLPCSEQIIKKDSEPTIIDPYDLIAEKLLEIVEIIKTMKGEHNVQQTEA